jgi:hypothetical protein
MRMTNWTDEEYRTKGRLIKDELTETEVERGMRIADSIIVDKETKVVLNQGIIAVDDSSSR